MTRIRGWLIVLLFLGVCAFALAQDKPAWSPAHYRGLTIGKSTLSDVRRVLGDAKYSGHEEDTGVPILSYEVNDPWPGYLIVYYKRGILTGLTLGLKDEVTKDDIIHQFGSDFVLTRYEFDDCRAVGGSAPVYESKDGSLEQMEYRRLGISVPLNGSRISQIAYTNIREPAPRSHCPPSSPK